MGPQLLGGTGRRRHESEKWLKRAPVGRNGPKGGQQPQMAPNAPQKMASNLGQVFPCVRPPYHHVFEPPTPGWRRSASTLLLKMTKNGPHEAEMGPKEAKTAQNGPKCPQNDPKPRKRGPLRKATLSPCVCTPNSRGAPVGSHITAKDGQKWAPGGRNGPKRGQQQQATSRWASFDISGTPIA